MSENALYLSSQGRQHTVLLQSMEPLSLPVCVCEIFTVAMQDILNSMLNL